jgi:phosphate/sulfate permease
MMALAGLMLYATVISVVGIVRRPINQLTRREALSIAITAAMCGLFAYLCTLPFSLCVRVSVSVVSCRVCGRAIASVPLLMALFGGQQRFSW